jgi:hypothetical protein
MNGVSVPTLRMFELDMTKRLAIDPASTLSTSLLDRKKVFTAK